MTFESDQASAVIIFLFKGILTKARLLLKEESQTQFMFCLQFSLQI